MTPDQQVIAQGLIIAGHLSPALPSEPAEYRTWQAWVRYCQERAQT